MKKEGNVMHGDAKYLIRFLAGADKRFEIPVYQRNYAWRAPQCKALYDDLIKIAKTKKNHFLGSIVSVYNPNSYDREYCIIDGQQRLTTISLLLLCMYHLLQRGEVVSKEKKLSQKIYEEYLIDKYGSEETKIKLKPIEQDREAFWLLFQENKQKKENSLITANYEYFYKRIQKQEISIDDLFESISRIMIIDISLNHEDNAQMIFESLNSTGILLEEGDKIRNYIFMGLSEKKQKLYYKKYWSAIEKQSGYDVSNFFKEYITLKQQKILSSKGIYTAFKEYMEQKDLEEECKEMEKYACWYEKLLFANTSIKKVNDAIERWKKLDFLVTVPFFWEVFGLWQQKYLTNDEVLEIFHCVECYLFRRVICDLPSAVLPKIFLFLHRDIFLLENNTKQYVAKLKYILLQKRQKEAFPSDEEFSKTFVSRNIYAMPTKTKHYILERLENKNSAETKNIYMLLAEGSCSIEHIMPQKLTQQWKEDLGEDWQKIHNLWLHRIANLTLTAYNGKYSNKSFLQKRDFKEIGLKESGFRMNQKIAQKQKWGLEELLQRSDELEKTALQIWSFSDALYQPFHKPLQEYTLEEEYCFRAKQIVKFYFQGVEEIVTSWRDFYEKILIMLHDKDKTVLNQLADNISQQGLSNYVARKKEFFQKQNCCQISDNIYVAAHFSTQQKINILKKFFILYKIESDEVIVSLKEE